MRECVGVGVPAAGQYISVHPDADTALSPQFGCSEPAASTRGTPGEETGREAWAGRAGQGSAPTFDCFAQQDRGPAWPATQCESRGDHTVQLLWMRKQVSGITGPTTST